MSSAKGAVLLLLLAAFGSDAAPPPAEDCANVSKRLLTKDLHEIFDHWVLVWAVSDHDVGHGLLAKLSSSHVEFKLDSDNKTIDIIERNRLVEKGHHDTCTTYFTKTTMPSDDAEHHTIKADSIKIEKNGIPHEYNDTGHMDFYKSCSDCLLMIYKTSKQQYLLVYRREGSHLDVEQHKADHDDHKKLAECLGFPHHQPFIYNGKADFCHKLSIPLSEECQPIVTPLSLDDPSVIFGEWVLVWSVSDHDEGHSLLASVSSSHVEFKALHDKQGVEFIERNVYLGSHGSCTVYYSNLTKAAGDVDKNTLKTSSIRMETDGVVQEYNDIGVVDFYKSCTDCLLMNYKTSTHRYLLFYKKEGSHQDVEQHKTHHDDHKKLAECLRFPHHQPFIYNGKADFCHKLSIPLSKECQPIVTPLSLDDPSVIFGEWVLVWSVSDHDEAHSLLASVSSSHVEFKALHDKQGVEFIERNVYLGSQDSCTVYYINLTKAAGDVDKNTLKTSSIRMERDGVVQEYNDIGVVDFYKSCTDCLLMNYKTSTHRYLLFYKKEGSHQDVEQHKTHHDDQKKIAECLRFPHHQLFIYNGKADFCHKKSAPEPNPEQS